MRYQSLSLVLLGAVLAACAYSQECPNKKDLLSCSCYVADYYKKNVVRCKGNQIPRHQMEDFRGMLQKNFQGKTNLDLHFTFSEAPTNLSSAFFNGLNVTRLRFVEWDVVNWADELGGKAFVGLEDSLEVLEVDGSLSAEKRAPLTLRHLRKLKNLRFLRNKIPVFGNDWLGGDGTETELKSLQNVFLPENGIAELGDRAFANLPDLYYLGVEGNDIKEVSRNMFPAEGLSQLNLRDNKIENLPEDLFENMPHLSEVVLAGNPIQYVRENTWKSVWSQLTLVSFERTDLHCDDHINWMTKTRGGPRVLGTCKTPADVAGQKLGDVLEKRRRA